MELIRVGDVFFGGHRKTAKEGLLNIGPADTLDRSYPGELKPKPEVCVLRVVIYNT